MARATEPLAFADDRVHAAYALQSVGLTALIEGRAYAADMLPSGRKLWRDRALQLTATLALAAVTTGARDRRAARRPRLRR